MASSCAASERYIAQTRSSVSNHVFRSYHCSIARPCVHHIATTRAEPIDHDPLMVQLSQAAISQLMDLAWDEREMVGLIVNKLIPALPKIFPPGGRNIDAPDDVVAQIVARYGGSSHCCHQE